LLQTSVCWLRRETVLERFQQLLPALLEFLRERGELFPELEGLI